LAVDTVLAAILVLVGGLLTLRFRQVADFVDRALTAGLGFLVVGLGALAGAWRL
jgi:hypothetical protein